MSGKREIDDISKRGRREHKNELAMRGDIKCGLCKYNRGENRKRQASHGNQKPKSRIRRRTRTSD